MPSSFGDLKEFRSIGQRPAQAGTSGLEALAKLDAGVRVMGAGFAMSGTVTVLHTMYIMLSIKLT
jgi:hypothetical protein